MPYDVSTGHLGHLVCGASAGLTSKFLVYPMDVVKKRLQVRIFGITCIKQTKFRFYEPIFCNNIIFFKVNHFESISTGTE